ncbi:nitrate regulatory gene2 protein [Malania oleifera]|uniref:nitrate regulatory gene2 protein n=1 Tax=Malania oleifera TaxID=397392 RepID=UPI0025AE42A0|nr:nitrate regulatory gene2 protein [Malania oleifera]
MGCAQSRIENEEAVSRCKERRNFMKEAVSERNAFAAGHSGYAVALKNTGAALSDYGHGEVEAAETDHRHQPDEHHHPMGGPVSDAAMDTTLPPPPPPPNFTPSPIQRSSSMPEFHRKPDRKNLEPITMTIPEDEPTDGDRVGESGKDLQGPTRRNGVGEMTPEAPLPPQTPPGLKGMAWDYFFMVDNMPGPASDEGDEIDGENDENEGEEFDQKENAGGGGNDLDGEIEPKTPERVVEKVEETPVKKGKQIVHANTAPSEFTVRNNAASSVNLLRILRAIDDFFLKASESAQEVSKMLEATRLHYHSNFADNRGHIDHSARVMRVITWNRSLRGMPNGEGGKDDFDSEEYETHATVLDKLLAWEKKLYDEVKAGELMKLEYRRKIALLNKQKKRGASSESLEKTKAAVSHLHTRYIVDMQSLDSTASEVNHLRDDQLYPKLVALVDGMAKMWENMCMHHDSQLNVASELKSLEISHTPKETSKQHHVQTLQLWKVIQEWHLQFEKLVTHQRQYIRALNGWLKLNLIPIESSLKEKISSPPKIQNPPIQILLHSWHDYLEKLPDEIAKTAISSFAAVIKTIIVHQEEEMKLKEKCEETRKEFLRKNQAFEEWYQKYMHRRTPPDEADPERSVDANPTDPVAERQFTVKSLKKKLEEEVEDHARHCVQVREKSLGSLKTRLPEIFRAMSDYAHACSETYQRLRSISQNTKSGAPA